MDEECPIVRGRGEFLGTLLTILPELCLSHGFVGDEHLGRFHLAQRTQEADIQEKQLDLLLSYSKSCFFSGVKGVIASFGR